MSYSDKRTCPGCGRPLELDDTGNLGYCSHHKQWYALSPGYEGLAAKKNSEIKNTARARQEEKDLNARVEAQQKYARSIRNIVLCVCAIVIISILIGIILFRPRMIYSSASEAYANGDYAAAIEEYKKINNYRDSELKIKLCEFLLNVSQPEEIVLPFFTSLVQEELTDEMATTVQETLNSWKEYGMEPETVLAMIGCIDDERIETFSIFIAAHVDMLSDSIAYRVKAESADFLISLTSDLNVECYRMLPVSNQKVYLENAEAGKYLIEFGKDSESTSPDKALDCYFEAFLMNADDISLNSIIASINSYPIGVERVHFRYRLFSVLSEDKRLALSIRDALSADITSVLVDNIGSYSASQLIEVILIAKKEKLTITGVDIDELFRKAALSLVEGNPSDYCFVDWNSNDIEELIVLSSNGSLIYHDFERGTETLFETGLNGGTVKVFGNVLIASDVNGISLFTYENGVLMQRVTDDDILNLNISEKEVTFSKKLVGSTERIGQYKINLLKEEIAVECVSLDWNKASYRMPESAEDTVLRWLETIAYDISEERYLLDHGLLISDIKLPADCEEIKIVPFYESEDFCYLFAGYKADDGSVITLSFITEKIADAYRITGVGTADQYSVILNYIATLNASVKGEIKNKNNSIVYYVVIPAASRMHVTWNAGEKNRSRNIYSISFSRSESAEQLFSYTLEESTYSQESFPLFLDAGIYEFIVRALVDDPSPFTFTLNAEIVPAIEKEPNGDADTATVLDFEKECFGVLGSSGDRDFYRFTLSEPCRITAEISAQEDGTKKSRFEVAVLKAGNNRILHSFVCDGDQGKVRSSNLYLNKGEYLISVSKGAYFYADSYSVKLSKEEGLLQEIEVNDSKDNATSLPLDKAVTGSLGTVNDSDWYRFIIPSDMVIRPRFRFSPIESAGKAYSVSIFSEQQELYKLDLNGRVSNYTFNPIVLTAGTYYIKLTGIQPNMNDYSLAIGTENVEMGESEPNDSLSSANLLEFGKSVTGSIVGEEDIDVFRCSFKTGESHTVRFTPPAGYDTSTVLYYLYLEQNGKTLHREPVKGNAGEIVLQLEIEEGDYFIKVRPGNNCFEIYSLRVDK